MDKLNGQAIPQSYVFPLECRPGEMVVPPCDSIPVIDLGGQLGNFNRTQTIQDIRKASQEFGFFQLINHGVPEKLMREVLDVAKGFFEMSAEDKQNYYSQNPHQSFGKDTSADSEKEEVHFWREHLQHICYPLDDQIQYWPQKPTQYREVIKSYSAEVRKLSLQLLNLISEGLGLEDEYFKNELGQVQLLGVNYYPPCPDPSLTLGLPKHSDLNLITLLNQGNIMGLHVLKDDQWLAVEPLPDAFVVNIGLSLQIVSNGKLRSVDHRVVTNSGTARTTVASFLDPSHERPIEPAKALVNEDNPSLYKAVMFKKLRETYMIDVHDGRLPLDRYKLQP